MYERGGFDGYYKITLLSNPSMPLNALPIVLLPYKITLLSNHLDETHKLKQFCYPIKLHYSQTQLFVRIFFEGFATL